MSLVVFSGFLGLPDVILFFMLIIAFSSSFLSLCLFDKYPVYAMYLLQAVNSFPIFEAINPECLSCCLFPGHLSLREL